MWGYHLTADCAGCNGNIKDGKAIAAFSAELVEALAMKVYGAPQIVRFGEDPKVTGYTLVQLIETSNITAHFCDYSGEAYIDIFSCKAFAIEDAMRVIDKHFAPVACNRSYQERLAPQLAAGDQIAAE